MNIMIYECPCCEYEIKIGDLEQKTNRVNCLNCNALFSIDTDAEFVDGAWKDRTKLVRIVW